jgi:hypothetical protein
LIEFEPPPNYTVDSVESYRQIAPSLPDSVREDIANRVSMGDPDAEMHSVVTGNYSADFSPVSAKNARFSITTHSKGLNVDPDYGETENPAPEPNPTPDPDPAPDPADGTDAGDAPGDTTPAPSSGGGGGQGSDGVIGAATAAVVLLVAGAAALLGGS